jgi:hypothetical protein
MRSSFSLINIITDALTIHEALEQNIYVFMDDLIQLDSYMVESANVCAFGQWLEEDAKAYLTLEEHCVIQQLHTQFHQMAAQIIRLKKEGKREEARGDLIDGGEFSCVSTRFMNRLIAIRDRALGGQNQQSISSASEPTRIGKGAGENPL